jgi:hypothetical protein
MQLASDADVQTEVNKWKELHIGEYVSHREMPKAALPVDRTFRDVWADTTPQLVIDVDMPKARTIATARLGGRNGALQTRIASAATVTELLTILRS